MALVLQLNEKEAFFVAGTKVTVEQVYSATRFQLKVHDPYMPTIYEVDTTHDVEILPRVFVKAGYHISSQRVCKVALSAPRNINIVREEVLNKKGVDDEGHVTV